MQTLGLNLERTGNSVTDIQPDHRNGYHLFTTEIDSKRTNQ